MQITCKSHINPGEKQKKASFKKLKFFYFIKFLFDISYTMYIIIYKSNFMEADKNSKSDSGLNLRDSNYYDKYRVIFKSAGIGLWEEDYSGVKEEIDKLKEKGVSNFNEYFTQYPEESARLSSLIKVIDVNDEVIAMHHAKSKKELLGSLDKITVPEALPVFAKALAAIAEGKDRFEHEVAGKTLDNKRIYTLLKLNIPKYNGHFKNMIVSTIDITEQKYLREQLIQNQKFESLGFLAGGIAHDFNNILTSILGNASLIDMTAELPEEAHSLLLEIEKAVSRAKSLTYQLLSFSRGNKPIKKLTSIKKLIEENVSFALQGSNTVKVLDIDGDLHSTEVDENQIGQVVNNLLINAREAMPKGGTVTVSAHNCRNKKKDPSICITIRDEGRGIPAKNINRIFDPAYSTKAKGYGLGLAISYSILKHHGSTISVESKEGKGTTFSFSLKASPKNIPAAITENTETYRENLSLRRVGSNILIMDDVEEIRKVLSRMLKNIGYNVFQTKDGEEAVNTYRNLAESGNTPDFVILDLTVPGGMGGKEAAGNILKINPNAYVIATSGYSTDLLNFSYAEYGFKDFLKKPYTFDEIKKIIAKVNRK